MGQASQPLVQYTVEQIEQKRLVAVAIKSQREIDRRVPSLESYLKQVAADPSHALSPDLMQIAIYRRMEEWVMVRDQMRIEYGDPFLLFAEPVFAFRWQFHPILP